MKVGEGAGISRRVDYRERAMRRAVTSREEVM